VCLRKINEQKGGQRVPYTKPVRSVIVPAVFVFWLVAYLFLSLVFSLLS
jgi:hypothetical protein